MVGGTTVETGLRQALVEVLSQLQSADSNIRNQAENRAKALEVTEGKQLMNIKVIKSTKSRKKKGKSADNEKRSTTKLYRAYLYAAHIEAYHICLCVNTTRVYTNAWYKSKSFL